MSEPRPTLNPTRDRIGANSLGESAKRDHVIVNLGQVTGADNFMVFRSTKKGRIKSAKVTANVAMYHAAAEADTWSFDVKNLSTAATLNGGGAASLSGITLAATAFLNIPIVGGNATLEANAGLQLQITESGTAQTLDQAMCVIEWEEI
tara:strand:+ start:1441 stop:1887 length:447 start_codon:yes stop_codon:yes gene_type:complete